MLEYLNYEEQISALNYAISVTVRELPEYDKDWFIEKKRDAEVNHIFKNRIYNQYFKGIMFYFAHSLKRLMIVILIFFAMVISILLPATEGSFILFRITYDNYSNNFIVNHLLNVITHFAGIDNEFKVEPVNWLGVLLLVSAKLFFVLIVVNFVYRKITDKLNIQ